MTVAYKEQQYWSRRHAENRCSLSAVGYQGLGEGFNKHTYHLRKCAALRILRRHPEIPFARIFEAGVGIGSYSPVWKSLGVQEWTGTDICAEAVEHCVALFPNSRFFVGDVASDEWPPEASGEYDFVTAIDVLYHLVNDGMFEAALRNLVRRVSFGGGLLVSDVFVEQDRQIAPHVKRRSLAAYQRALGGSMNLVDREPVFSILAGPVPRSRWNALDRFLDVTWRVIAKTIVLAPSRLRDATGAVVATAAWPLDAFFRRAGLSGHVNLELALFRKGKARF